ncbi:hypothetical protein Bbelb_182390 [Branchiostoma belcheri]|nr:hypothetical protein Bbelb_182390 [Branchiostoma belcheri]
MTKCQDITERITIKGRHSVSPPGVTVFIGADREQPKSVFLPRPEDAQALTAATVINFADGRNLEVSIGRRGGCGTVARSYITAVSSLLGRSCTLIETDEIIPRKQASHAAGKLINTARATPACKSFRKERKPRHILQGNVISKAANYSSKIAAIKDGFLGDTGAVDLVSRYVVVSRRAKLLQGVKILPGSLVELGGGKRLQDRRNPAQTTIA